MLEFKELALRRGPKLLLEQVSMQIHPGQKVGVTGANGSGKSSLFALILGEIGPDHGDFSLPRDWVVAHVSQQTPSDSRPAIEYVLDGDAQLRSVERELSAARARGDGEAEAHAHAAYESIDGYAARSRAGRLLAGLGFAPDDEERPVDAFSGGWRMRLNLAQALMCRSDLLLLDEPTNHLDLDTVIWLEGWLKAYAGTLLMVSHDRDFLDGVVGHVVHLEHNRATLTPGNYSAFERIRAERLAQRRAEFKKQQREIAHMRAFVERFRAKATKARQAQSRLKALARMELIAPAHVDSPFHFSLLEPEKNPVPLLKLDAAAAGYGAKTVLSGVRLALSPGDRIGLLGLNGAGKSTLIKLLAGMLQPTAGERLPARDLSIGYFAQHQLDHLDPEASPLLHLIRLDPDAPEEALRTYLGGFGFSGDDALRPSGPFSGGEKSRLALALLTYRRPNLLLLDEPTNHLDLEMRQALAVALQEFPGAMVIVSHDRHLLRVSCDRLLLVDAGTVDEFDGSLDDYPAWLVARSRARREPAAPTRGADARKAERRRGAEQRRLLAPLRRQLRQAEEALTALHARQRDLERDLADPQAYAEGNKDRLKALLAEQADLSRAVAAEESRWLECCEALERVS